MRCFILLLCACCARARLDLDIAFDRAEAPWGGSANLSVDTAVAAWLHDNGFDAVEEPVLVVDSGGGEVMPWLLAEATVRVSSTTNNATALVLAELPPPPFTLVDATMVVVDVLEEALWIEPITLAQGAVVLEAADARALFAAPASALLLLSSGAWLLPLVSLFRGGGTVLGVQVDDSVRVTPAAAAAIDALDNFTATADVCLLLPPAVSNLSFCLSLRADGGCQQCVPGFFWDNATCAACPSGSVMPDYGGTAACRACALGTTTQGLRGQRACVPCPPGTATYPDPTQCTPCAGPLQLALAAGTARCGCVAGTALDITGTVCAPCGPGTYQPVVEGLGACLLCPDLQWTDVPMQATACRLCAPGAYAAPDGACASCPPGTFAPSASSSSPFCAPCVGGAYAPSPSSTACLVCAPGTFQPSFAFSGASACAACPPGSYVALPAATACADCTPGAYAGSAGATLCDPCDPGTHQPAAGASACAACAVPYQTVSSLDRTGCVCAAGAVLFGPRCLPCLPGYFKALPDNNNSSSSTCEICPFPTTTSPDSLGATACAYCMPGTSGACVACDVGTYGAPSTFYANGTDDVGPCTPCAPGAYGPLLAQTACVLCAAGTYASAAGLDACAACPDHSTSDVGAAVSCACDAYWSWNADTQQCQRCPPGSIQLASLGGGVCVPCGPGTYPGDIGRGPSCVSCPFGTFAPTAGWAACLPCPPYMTTFPGGRASQCFCAAGAILDYATLTCVPCPLGTAFVSVSEPCAPCPAGTYGGAAMALACAPCPDGTDAPLAGATACLDCAEWVTPDRTACHCPPGFFNGSTGCAACLDACPDGQFMEKPCRFDADAECAPCSDPADVCGPSEFVVAGCSADADVRCWPCSGGCLLEGAYVIENCSLWGNLQCGVCAPACDGGAFMARPCTLYADLRCEPCPPGAISPPANRATACTQCAPGFAALNASTCCTACAAYSSPDRTQCVDACPTGAYAAWPQGCAMCPPGTFRAPDMATCAPCAGLGGTVSEGQDACHGIAALNASACWGAAP